LDVAEAGAVAFPRCQLKYHVVERLARLLHLNSPICISLRLITSLFAGFRSTDMFMHNISDTLGLLNLLFKFFKSIFSTSSVTRLFAMKIAASSIRWYNLRYLNVR
jgi:hypothetical protein